MGLVDHHPINRAVWRLSDDPNAPQIFKVEIQSLLRYPYLVTRFAKNTFAEFAAPLRQP